MVKKWALILGASSGFGGASAVELAKAGYNIFGIHLDRQITMPNVNSIIKKIERTGQKALFFNMNAADQLRRSDTLDEIKDMFVSKKETQQQINVVLHSLAFGSLKPFISKSMATRVTKAQMEMTLDVMAHSLVYWVQGLVERELLANKARIFGLTSAGSQTIFPSYGAVSAAKASLESHIRQLAAELGVMGVTSNAIMAGVTDTPALRKIPGNEKMMTAARDKNPGARLTTPMDVAKTIVMLMDEKADWISGNVLQVDGGEFIVNYTGEKFARPIK